MVLKTQVFCEVTPCRQLNIYRRTAVIWKVKWFYICLTLKMTALESFEMSVTIYPSVHRRRLNSSG